MEHSRKVRESVEMSSGALFSGLGLQPWLACRHGHSSQDRLQIFTERRILIIMCVGKQKQKPSYSDIRISSTQPSSITAWESVSKTAHASLKIQIPYRTSSASQVGQLVSQILQSIVMVSPHLQFRTSEITSSHMTHGKRSTESVDRKTPFWTMLFQGTVLA